MISIVSSDSNFKYYFQRREHINKTYNCKIQRQRETDRPVEILHVNLQDNSLPRGRSHVVPVASPSPQGCQSKNQASK